MILCCKPGFVIPFREFVYSISSQKCKLLTSSAPLLTRSIVPHKLKPCSRTIENLLSCRYITHSTFYHSNRFNNILPDSNRFYREKHQLRYYSDVVDEKKSPEKKLGLFKRFEQMYKEYWYVLLPVHIITSTVWFGSFYYLVKSGVDIVELMQRLGVGETLIEKLQKSNGTMGYLTVAWAMYKIATPARYFVTLGGTTLSIKYLRDWGYIKPIPPPEKLKEMIDEKKKVILRGRRPNLKKFCKDNCKEKIENQNRS